MAKKKAAKAGHKRVAKARKAKAKPATRKAVKKILRLKPKKIARPVMPKVLTGKPNLLVTYDPNHKGIAEAELKDAFTRIGEKYEVSQTGIDGLFKLKTQDARRVVKKISELLKREQQALSTTHRYIPIDDWTKSEVQDIQKSIKNLLPNIGQNERWKMNISKRHWDKMHSTELIIKLTEVIDRAKVDLERPEKIVQVEIIGNEAGIALLKPDEMLDVVLVKG